MNEVVVKSYSDAIYELFLEGKDKKFLADLKQTYKDLKLNQEYVDYISCRFFKKEQRKASVEKIFAKRINPLITNLICSLIDHEQAENVCYVLKRGVRLINADLDIDFAIIETPFEIEEAQLNELIKALSKKYNKKIDYEIKLNPTLIGGLKITLGENIIDGSVRGKLDSLKTDFVKGVKKGE